MPRLLTPTPQDTPDAPERDDAVQAAARCLQQGGLVGLPTETVYGLAADAGQPAAVARIFETKGRPADHPLIVHLPPDWAPGVAHHASEVPVFARALMQAFWPGPLTLILPRREGVASAAAGGQTTIGLRCPSHPVAQAVLGAARALGVHGVAAPSANRFGRVSPTTAQHVMDEFASLSPGELTVLDGGACDVGIESTIVDCTRGAPVVLRPGMLTLAQIASVCGALPAASPHVAQPAPKTSGTLESHYAPRARVRLMAAHELRQALELLGSNTPAGRIAVFSRSQPQNPGLTWRSMPDDAAACAHRLFAVLRDLDATGVALIWVETPPDTPDWQGVRDRLQRAAA